MIADGYRVIGFDGTTDQVREFADLRAPLKVCGVRPDALGVHNETGEYAFAEAKTAGDINNQHTRTQLRVLGSTSMIDGRKCALYLAVPRRCAYDLDRALIQTGLIGARHLRRIHVPEVMLG